MGGVPGGGGLQSWQTSAMYLFNIIVGTGVLALPHIFAAAGLGLGTLFLLITACLSYMVSTFLTEMLSIVTALQQLDNGKLSVGRSIDFDADWTEQSGAAAMYILPRWGQIMWFSVIVIYMFGDLAVYTVFLPSALATVIPNVDLGFIHAHADGVYYATLTLMVLIMTPLSFFVFRTTKYLQMFTTFTRHLAFWVMIGVAIFRDSSATTREPESEVTWFKFSQAPLLFGGATYALICQHYIPQLTSVIRDKGNVRKMLLTVFAAVMAYFLVLCWTGVYAFASTLPAVCHSGQPCRIQAMFTFTFEFMQPSWIGQGIVLLPLAAVATNFPLIAITLRDNIIILIKLLVGSKTQHPNTSVNGTTPTSSLLTPVQPAAFDVTIGTPITPRARASSFAGTPRSHRSAHQPPLSRRRRAVSDSVAAALALDELAHEKVTEPNPRPAFGVRVVTGMAALAPPFIVGYITKNIDLVVRVSGSYGGAVIMFVMPVVFIVHARRAEVAATTKRPELAEVFDRNPHRSGFRHPAWYCVAVGWAALAVIVNTYSFAAS